MKKEKISREIIRAYALENAISHKGKTIEGPVINALFKQGLEKQDIPLVIQDIQKIIKDVNALSFEKQQKEFEQSKDLIQKREIRQGLPELSQAEQGKVVLRFAPFPSGPLHIGNTRQLILNDEYAKKYSSKLTIVMDDTIGSEAKPIQKQAYNLIEQGISWLNIKHDKKIIYKSDRLKTYYEYAEELIKKGYMYVCSCDRETIQNLRRKAIDCECRNNTDTENLEKYKQMFSKEAQPGELVVRLKTSMQHKNPAFRDRIMFRISNQEHPKTKNKYKVWPLLEFSWAIDDHLLGITHIIRGIDLLMESQVEEHIWDIFNWEKPQIIHTGHFSIEGLKISKSKGAQEVLSGEYIGWNDPRTWSLQALKDRGILPESIREFINSMGITKSNSKIAIDILYTINRKNLENKPRYFFIPNPVKIKINGAPELEPEIPLHPSQTLNLGTRTYKTFQEFFISKKDFDCMKHESENNENYRFMHLFNFQIKKDSLSNKLELRFLSEEHEKNLEAKFIQWISATNKDKDNNIKTTIRMPDNSIIEGLAEPEIINIKPSDIIQFERFGFVRLHKIDKKTKTAEFWFSHK